MFTAKKALILIPCSDNKQVDPEASTAPPMNGVEELRRRLHALLRERLEIRARERNLEGLFNERAPRTPAFRLYRGALYKELTGDWSLRVVGGDGPVEILIVSAAYGLVHPTEALATYDVKMGDRADELAKVYRFWHREGLPRLLEEYLNGSSITHVWSLLPDSEPALQYHRVFKPLWVHAEDLGRTCYHVEAQNRNGATVGQDSGRKRGMWLHAVLRSRPAMLWGGLPLEFEMEVVPGFSYEYRSCR